MHICQDINSLQQLTLYPPLNCLPLVVVDVLASLAEPNSSTIWNTLPVAEPDAIVLVLAKLHIVHAHVPLHYLPCHIRYSVKL
jgi:hypothetical protein